MQTRLTPRATFSFAAFSALAALGAACSQATTGPYSDVSAFCQQKAKAECQYAPSCAVDIPTCQAHRASVCNADATAATASGARKYTSGNAQACIDALNAAYAKNSTQITFAELFGHGSITDLCERVFSGNTDSAKPCTSDYDCSSNRICSPATPGSSKKECADPVPTTTYCSNPGQICGADTYCAVQTDGTAQCQASAGAGQACSASIPCVSTQRCLAGTCQNKALAGEACVTNDDCPAVDPYCDPYVGNICTAGLGFVTQAPDCVELKGGASSGGGDASSG